MPNVITKTLPKTVDLCGNCESLLRIGWNWCPFCGERIVWRPSAAELAHAKRVTLEQIGRAPNRPNDES